MTLTPDRLEEPVPNLLQQYTAAQLIECLERQHEEALRDLQQRQIEAVLGTPITQEPWATASGQDIYSDLVEHRRRIYEEPHYTQAQRVIDEQRERYAQQDRERERYLGYYSTYGERDWYCYCSPSRGRYWNRQQQEAYAHYGRWAAPMFEPTPVTLSEDELAHICHPDADGVCVWANCPNASRGDEATWELVDEAELMVTTTTWLRGDDEPNEPKPSTELVLARKAVRVAQEETQRMELALSEVIPVSEPTPRPSLARRVLAGVCALIL